MNSTTVNTKGTMVSALANEEKVALLDVGMPGELSQWFGGVHYGLHEAKVLADAWGHDPKLLVNAIDLKVSMFSRSRSLDEGDQRVKGILDGLARARRIVLHCVKLLEAKGALHL